MQEPGNELDRIRAAVERLMQKRDIKRKPLAKKAQLGETSIRDLLDNPERDIKVGTLHKIADALDVSIEDLVNSGDLRIRGKVGAGGEVIYDEVVGDRVPRPPGLGGALEPLEVEGVSMLPRYSPGDVVYIARLHDGIAAEDVGEFCVARLTTGETYVKQLARGTRPGFWTLRSLNAEDIEDVELDWATPIIFVLPRAARRRLGY